MALISVHGCPLGRLGSKDVGGMSVYVHQLALGLGRLGFEVDIYTRDHGPHESSIINLGDNVRVVHLVAGPVGAAKEDLYKYLPEFLLQVKIFVQRHLLSYDIVHSHYWLSGWVGQALVRDWGVSHLVTFHTLAEIKTRARIGEGEGEARSLTEHRLVSTADRIIASTYHELGELQHLYHATASNISVIPAGVDLNVFMPGDRQAARAQLGLDDVLTILYVGRFEAIKGLEVLLYALTSLEVSGRFRLLVAGGGAPMNEGHARMGRLVKELDIEDNVEFLGGVGHGTLPMYYHAAHVCVVPSYYESFGLVALEAMACGTPVVAARVGGLPSIVQDNRTGYLVPWHCPDAFADRLEVLLSNDSLRESMAEHASIIARQMSWDNTVSATAEVYSELSIVRS